MNTTNTDSLFLNFEDRQPDGSERALVVADWDNFAHEADGWFAIVANDDGCLCNVGKFNSKKEAEAVAARAVAQIAADMVEA
jgi:hypothetical protein